MKVGRIFLVLVILLSFYSISSAATWQFWDDEIILYTDGSVRKESIRESDERITSTTIYISIRGGWNNVWLTDDVEITDVQYSDSCLNITWSKVDRGCYKIDITSTCNYSLISFDVFFRFVRSSYYGSPPYYYKAYIEPQVCEDGNPNQIDTLRIRVEEPPKPDIEVLKRTSTTRPKPGDNITFTIGVRNIGQGTATNLQISDRLPAGLTYVSSNASRGTYNPSTGIWDIGTLSPGEDVSLTIVATVNSGTEGRTIRNIARVSNMDQEDANPDNNQAVVELYVQAPKIEGYIYEDVNGDSQLDDPIQGVKVYLYKDNGDGVPSSGDTLVKSTQTDSSGKYSFTASYNQTYWVVVDSDSIEAPNGYNSGFDKGYIWAEQTYGSGGTWGGALCDTDANPSTPPQVLSSSGACYGGAYGDRSDGFFKTNNITDAEHIAKVNVVDSDVYNVNFAFSFNVVTNTRDQDDDTNNPRTCQGCLRQFIQNANAIQGANYMRFVPAVPPNAGNWWSITLNSTEDSTNKYALPAITDSQTTIDGTAYSYQNGTSVRDTNPGSISAPGTAGTDDIPLSPYEKPELEINANDKGIVFAVNADNVTIRRVAIYNSQDFSAPGISVGRSRDNVEISDNFIGPRADGTDPGQGNRLQHGIDLRSYSDVDVIHNFVGFIDNTGIIFNGEGYIERNYIYKVGLSEECGDGITFEFIWTSIDSYVRNRATTVVRENYISDSAAYGVESWRAPGAYTIENNTITNSGIGNEDGEFCGDGNMGTTEWGGIRLFGSGSLVKKNKIYNNRGSGVVVVALDNSTPSKNNEITQNSFYNNGGISIDLDQTHTDGVDDSVNPNGDHITPNDGTKNSGQQNEGIDYPIFTTVELAGGNLHVIGRVGTSSSSIPETFTIELYRADDDGNNNGEIEVGDGKNVPHGEGREYIGSCTTANDGTFDCSIPASVSVGDSITAIAIDSNGNTSEFSPNYVVSSPGTISGYLFNDANHNTLRENSENGIPNVRMELWYYDGSNWVLEATTTTNSDGSFQFNPLNTGRYRIIEDAQNSGNDANTGSDPTGYISTTPNVVEISFSGKNTVVEFGDFHGSKVEGHSFEDDGDGTTTSTHANNAIFDPSVERGLERVIVKACADANCTTVIERSITDNTGKYELWIPASYDGDDVYIIEETPNGYISTGDSKGNTVDSNYADPIEERDKLTYHMNSGEIVKDYNFGNVKKLSIVPSINVQIDRGTSATITHRINVGTPSVIAISYSSEEGWNYTVYNDSDCDGVLEGNKINPNGGFYYLNNGDAVDKGVYCVVLKVVAPDSVPQGTQDKLDVIANADWINTSQGFDDLDDTTDTITVRAEDTIGSGNLVLEKWVRNITKGEDFGKTNDAKPCDILEYRIDFKNIGLENIYKLVIADIIPVHTRLIVGGYNGHDIKIELITGEYTDVFYADLGDPGVELDSSNTLKVEVYKLIAPYIYISPGVIGRLYYRVQVEGRCTL